jgi:hypothetical protein
VRTIFDGGPKGYGHHFQKWRQTLFCAAKTANISKMVHSTKIMNIEEITELAKILLSYFSAGAYGT